MASLQFGIFDWLDDNRAGLAETYEQRLKMLEYADANGYFAYHQAEHHGTPLSIAPSPNLFFTLVAQRTRRLRFGPMVYPLPMYEPVRLIEGFLDLTGANYVAGAFAFGNLTDEQVLRSLDLFTPQVRPRLVARQPAVPA